MARPTLLDDLRSKRIIDAIGRGASQVDAANAAGVSERALQNWIARGRQETTGPYMQFVQRLEEAHGKAGVFVSSKLMERIEEGNVPAILAWLYSRRPKEWQQKPAQPIESVSQAMADEVGQDVEMLESLLSAAKSRKAV